MTKFCHRCSTEKARSEFNKNRPECRACSALVHRAYRARSDGAKDKAYQRSPKYKAILRSWYARGGKETAWKSSIARLYGLTAADYEALLEMQGGVCAVCQQPPRKGKRLCVDHDHGSNIVRGLVCIGCNLLIYQLERVDEASVRARAYLANPPAAMCFGAPDHFDGETVQ